MKTLIILLIALLPLAAISQPGKLDTVKINTTLKIKDWGYISVMLKRSDDSLSLVYLNTIQTAVKASPTKTAITNVTINNVPATILVQAFNNYQNLATGLAKKMGTDLYDVITAIQHPVVQWYIGGNESAYESEATRTWRVIKNLFGIN